MIDKRNYKDKTGKKGPSMSSKDLFIGENAGSYSGNMDQFFLDARTWANDDQKGDVWDKWMDYNLTLDQRDYEERLRNYDNATNQLSRLMAAGMSREAALAILSGAGEAGSPSSAVGPADSLAPSESYSNISNGIQANAETIKTLSDTATNAAEFGMSVPIIQNQQTISAYDAELAQMDLQGMRTANAFYQQKGRIPQQIMPKDTKSLPDFINGLESNLMDAQGNIQYPEMYEAIQAVRQNPFAMRHLSSTFNTVNGTFHNSSYMVAREAVIAEGNAYVASVQPEVIAQSLRNAAAQENLTNTQNGVLLAKLPHDIALTDAQAGAASANARNTRANAVAQERANNENYAEYSANMDNADARYDIAAIKIKDAYDFVQRTVRQSFDDRVNSYLNKLKIDNIDADMAAMVRGHVQRILSTSDLGSLTSDELKEYYYLLSNSNGSVLVSALTQYEESFESSSIGPEWSRNKDESTQRTPSVPNSITPGNGDVKASDPQGSSPAVRRQYKPGMIIKDKYGRYYMVNNEGKKVYWSGVRNFIGMNHGYASKNTLTDSQYKYFERFIYTHR